MLELPDLLRLGIQGRPLAGGDLESKIWCVRSQLFRDLGGVGWETLLTEGGLSKESSVPPGGACLVQPRWMPERRILGGGWTRGVSFWPFMNYSRWWWLISSVFLTRTSCRKTTHANRYYGAWPGWAVSVNVLPLIMWNKIFIIPVFSRHKPIAILQSVSMSACELTYFVYLG